MEAFIAAASRNRTEPNFANELRAGLLALNTRIQRFYPATPPEPYYVDGGPWSNKAELIGNQVVIGKDVAAKLTAKELIAVIAHEHGHYHMGHGISPPPPYYKDKRIDECRADHFAARFIPDPKAMASAVLKLDNSNPLNDTLIWMLEKSGFQPNIRTHPFSGSREAFLNHLKQNPQLLNLPSETIKLGDQCEVNEPLHPPPPAYAKPPETLGGQPIKQDAPAR